MPSNPLVIHVHDLPQAGRPAGFSGAIGQFTVSGDASPTTVNVGDPVYLDFTISGNGNFDSVRAPALGLDPAWKSYVPSSKMNYQDQARTEGTKIFQQAIIPNKNGTLPLPAANFSYFDPTAKKYVTIPIPLPAITVTGAPTPVAATTPANGASNPSVAVTPASASTDLAPNRLEFGLLRSDIAPAYRHPWFWISQGALLAALLLTSLLLAVRSRRKADDAAAERVSRLRTLSELEKAMSDAVAANDAPGFFLAARARRAGAVGRRPAFAPRGGDPAADRRARTGAGRSADPAFQPGRRGDLLRRGPGWARPGRLGPARARGTPVAANRLMQP